ncbi:MAG: caspase family protein [Thiomargarita sp.]|nr:caspase family protein [Thiomargarita sp.]
MKKILAFFATTLLLFSGCASTPNRPVGSIDSPQKALVIGNASYKETSKLKSPLNDAAAMAKELEEMGFYVIRGFDLDLQGMNKKIAEFTNVLKNHSKKGDIALFYFSGHGTGVDGKNYVVPIDAELDIPEKESVKKTIDTESISIKMTDNNKFGANFMILDSCRNDRFTDRPDKGSPHNTFRPKPLSGTLTAYSAGEGQVAKDGTKEGYSLYTKHLLGVLHNNNVKNKPVQIRDVLGYVEDAVYEESKGKQNPQTRKGKGSTADTFCFGFLGCEKRIPRFPRAFPRST